jgi:hypothetical protein
VQNKIGQMQQYQGFSPTPNQAAYQAIAADLFNNCGVSTDPWTPPSTGSSGGGGTTTTTTPAPTTSTVVVNPVR